MLTRRGIASVAAGITILILARITAIHELYVLGVAGVAFPAVAVVFVRMGRAKLHFERALTPVRIFAGGTLRVSVRVVNAARVTSPPLQLDENAPSALGGPRRVSIPSLRPHASELFASERHASQRGRKTFPPLRVRLVDPFGFAQISKDVSGSASVTVYPKIDMLHERTPREARSGHGRSALHRLASGGDDFYAVREYQEGDDLRRIHWRSSARRDELMIRQDEVRPFPRATILLDTRAASHPGDATSLEWAISAAASLVWELSTQGFALRIATTDTGPGGARWGREAVDPLLTTLALTPLSNMSSLVPSIRRCGRRPASGGVLVAVLPTPAEDELAALAATGRSYGWRGAVLIDTPSFLKAAARERAAADQRLADAERALLRAGWRAHVAGSSDRFPEIWQTLLDAPASRPSSLSQRS